MDRRKFFTALSTVTVSAMAPLRLVAEPLPRPTPTLLTKEQWLRETFGEHDKQFNPYPLIASFVASHPGVYLFKNRSGQWIYQTYDPKSGNPVAHESVFLVSGKPSGTDFKPGIMPHHLEVKNWGGVTIVGLTAAGTESELNSDLKKAYELLVSA